MAQTVLITLTTAGTDVGPFDLYSDANGYASSFQTGVPRSILVAGYICTIVPDGATTIKVQSYGSCTNNIYLNITGDIPTTTTTTTSTSSSTTTTSTSTSTTTSTTTAVPYDVLLEFFGEVVGLSFDVTGRVVYGTVADNMTWDGLIDTYTSNTCAGIPDSSNVAFTLSFSIGNTAGHLTHDIAVAPYTGINTSNIISLNLLSPSTIITTNNQDITVGGTVYRIQGYGLCNPI
jgi:hypothetical protein